VATDSEVRCLVLAANGRAFSAGQDLDEMSEILANGWTSPEADAHLQRLQEITRRMVNMPKPIIAAVNGVAVGAGVELPIASDIRIASERASFAFPEVRHGLFETNGVMFFLTRIVGYGRAMEWMLTGRTVSAKEAFAAGLVTHVTAPDELLPKALEIAREIRGNAPISLRLIKRGALEGQASDLEAVLRSEVAGMKECLSSSDLDEGVRAFFEKRRPAFVGA